MNALTALVAFAVIGLAAPPAAREDEPVIAGENNVPAPKKTKTVLPVYPPDAQARGLRGIVIVELVIDTQGKVSSAQVVRSIPPFDEAALAAVRQWEYEVTKVGGKPVSVKLTVPITFAMKVPEIASRQEGIPELRAGAFPPVPSDARDPASATAELTLGPDGTVDELRLVDGPPAFADALARALRTWRFAPDSAEATVTFRVRAQFVPAAKGTASRVEFRLDGLRRSESMEATRAAAAAPAAVTPPEPPAVAPSSPATPTTEAPAATPVPSSTPSERPGPAPTNAPAPSAVPPPPSAPPGSAAPPAAVPPPSDAGPAATSAPAAPRPAEPAMEVLTVGPPPPPPENGLSAIRDVTLAPGVPDLTRGRRPVPPPMARMAQATGTVEVAFSVDAAGIAAVKGSNGPDVFKRAAEQAVASWTFRRTRADRIFLVAEFKYDLDAASAAVRPDVK